MIIWLQGPSGAGKTTVGPALARLRGVPFLDLDELIEAEAGKSILDIFWHDGETAFRRMEWNVLLRIMEGDPQPAVIALGGGAVADPAIRSMTRESGIRIFLDVDGATAIERLQGGAPRPLLFEEDPLLAWKRLYRQRLAWYQESELTLASDAPPEQLAEHLNQKINQLLRPTWQLQTSPSGQPCSITGYAALPPLVGHLHQLAAGRKVALVIDSAVAQLYHDQLGLDDGSQHLVLRVEAGEGAKNFQVVEEFAGALAAAGFTRDSLLVGIGGGVVTDVAGFLASVFMRGIPCAYIPTTLLGQVDAAIGGKTAINVAGIRNLVGTIRQPTDVLVCGAFLRSLSARELRSGFVESVKMGIANSAQLAGAAAEAAPAILQGQLPENLDEVIRLSIATKIDVVERDTFDASLRMSLNLGHTVGHALESVAPGSYAHGEAVAFGLIAAAEMAHEIGVITNARRNQIADSALPFTLPAAPAPPAERMIRAMLSDKKRAGAGIRFVLPTEHVGVRLFDTEDMEMIAEILRRATARVEGS